MHELSICQSLIDQLTALTQSHGAAGVARAEVEVGILSGVEARLLESAFEIAQVGTVAEKAKLETRVVEPRVRCARCGAESDVTINDLRCLECQNAQTKVIRGQDLILARVELVMEPG
jgi:hydrogenase nickel incorporation protein HypA/HybF